MTTPLRMRIGSSSPAIIADSSTSIQQDHHLRLRMFVNTHGIIFTRAGNPWDVHVRVHKHTKHQVMVLMYRCRAVSNAWADRPDPHPRSLFGMRKILNFGMYHARGDVCRSMRHGVPTNTYKSTSHKHKTSACFHLKVTTRPPSRPPLWRSSVALYSV